MDYDRNTMFWNHDAESDFSTVRRGTPRHRALVETILNIREEFPDACPEIFERILEERSAA